MSPTAQTQFSGQLHQLQTPSSSNNGNNVQWHSGHSPYHYELVTLTNRVKKCYGCGQDFAQLHRKERVKGKDQQGNLVYSQDFQAAYYHLNPSHILRKNAFFKDESQWPESFGEAFPMRLNILWSRLDWLITFDWLLLKFPGLLDVGLVVFKSFTNN